jgi:hypothetical protein
MPQGKAGKERTIEVKLAPDAARRYAGAEVRARRGYIVPGD